LLYIYNNYEIDIRVIIKNEDRFKTFLTTNNLLEWESIISLDNIEISDKSSSTLPHLLKGKGDEEKI